MTSEVAWGKHGRAGWYYELDGDAPPIAPVGAVAKLTCEEVTHHVLTWINRMQGLRYATLSAQLGVSIRSLKRLEVGWNPELDCYTFPMRRSDGKYVGVRYRFKNGDKRSLKGSTEGLFIPQSTLGGHTLFVAEGMSDPAALLDCGLDAIGRPNNIGGMDEIAGIVVRFRPRLVVVVDDHDTAGALGGEMLVNQLHATPVGVDVRRIRPTKCKDARECVRFGGRRVSILEAVSGIANKFWEPVSRA